MKKLLIAASLLLVPCLTKAATVTYIQSTNTYQANGVINIASASIRGLTVSSLTVTGVSVASTTVSTASISNLIISNAISTGTFTFNGSTIVHTNSVTNGTRVDNSTITYGGPHTYNTWNIFNGTQTVNGNKTDNSTSTYTGSTNFASSVTVSTLNVSNVQWVDNYFQRYSQFINAKDYGVKGDGISNDAVAFQAAIVAATGKALYVPTGVYMVNPTTVTTGITIFGDGIDKTIIRSRLVSSQNDNGVINSNKLAVSSVTLTNLTIDINRALNNNNTGLKGVYLGSTPYSANATISNNIILDSIRVTGGSQHNIQLGYTQYSKVVNCTIDDFWNIGLILFRSGLKNTISNNTVFTSTFGASAFSAEGIVIDDRSTDSTNGDQGIYNIISNNVIEGNNKMSYGVDIEGSWGNIISNNQIRGVKDVPIFLSQSGPASIPTREADYNVVSGNFISSQTSTTAGLASILVQGSNNSIYGNIISTGYAPGIWVIASSSNSNQNNVISGNVISTNTSTGILVNQAEGLIISNNAISNISNGYGMRLNSVALASNGGFITNVNITGNTIQNITGPGISVESDVNKITGVNITGNIISTTSSNAINLDGITSTFSVVGISNNQIFDWDTAATNTIYAIKVASTTGALANVVIRGNQMTKSGASGRVGIRVNGFVRNLVMSENRGFNLTTDFSDNTTVGSIVYERGNSWNGKEFAGTAAPGAGTWAVGDIVWFSNPSAGGNIGAVCTTAGTPGTWKTFGAIAP